MDGSFLAIATLLHLVPRGAGDLRGKRRAGSLKQDGREPDPRDVPDGWIRVAL